MTNEQLAIFLANFRKQLATIFDQLWKDLENTQGLDYHQEKGEWLNIVAKPKFEIGEGFAMSEGYRKKIDILNDPANWAWTDGCPICLDALGDFIDNIEKSESDLLGKSDGL